MIELRDAGVTFTKRTHQYFDKDGKELHGITSTLLRWMFPDTYANIDPGVLERAAEYGSGIHEAIEMYEAIGDQGIQPVKDCYRMLEEKGLSVVRHEYIITNGKFASQIDLVLSDKEGHIWLGDIKCTSKLHVAKTTAQLAIYTDMFEGQNPHLQVAGIVAIWLPKEKYGKSEIRELTHKATRDDIQEIYSAYEQDDACDKYREMFETEQTDAVLPAEVTSSIYNLRNVLNEIEQIEKIKKTLVSKLQEAMSYYGVRRIENEEYGINVTLIPEGTRASVDTKKLKEEFPEAYNACLKEIKVKETIKISRK